jgi:type 1 glutamine amidotransferase
MVDALLGADQIVADLSQDYQVLANGLNPYDAVLFYTDVGTLTDEQERGLLDFVRGGGGFFGLHTADASFRDCTGYHAMLNGFFDGHSKYMDFTVTIVDPDHPITRGLADFGVTDELHYLKHDPAMSHHLMQAYDPTRDETHVMAFTHSYGKGRVFFFALGHDMAVLGNPSFLEVLRRGTLWAGRRL